MPIRLLSAIVQLCRAALWPTVTLFPITVPCEWPPKSNATVLTTTPSCRFVLLPTVILPASPADVTQVAHFLSAVKMPSHCAGACLDEVSSGTLHNQVKINRISSKLNMPKKQIILSKAILTSEDCPIPNRGLGSQLNFTNNRCTWSNKGIRSNSWFPS